MNTEHQAENRVVTVGVGALSIADVVAVARHGAKVELDPAALDEIAATRARVEELANDPTPVYGISTGFGALARRHIPEDMRAELQVSLVRSHAAGTGPEVEDEVVRALMLLRLSTLCTGRTGVRPVVAETYAAVLNAHITPVVREYGSLGCSGDLAPLAHCALTLIGEGECRVNQGPVVASAQALAAAGITPLVLREKEGLALINGTDGMLGMLCLAIDDLHQAAKVADISAAMASKGSPARSQCSMTISSSCAHTPAKHNQQPISALWPPAQTSSALPQQSSKPSRSKTPTLCAAHPRSQAGSVTLLHMPSRWPTGSWRQQWTTRLLHQMGA